MRKLVILLKKCEYITPEISPIMGSYSNVQYAGSFTKINCPRSHICTI